MVNWPEYAEIDEVALPLIIELDVLDRGFCLWKVIILDIFGMELFCLIGQVNLILDILMWSLLQDFGIGDSIDATLPPDHLSLVLVHQNVLVGEEGVMGDNWLAHLPNMALGPSHVAFKSFPRS